MGKYSELFETLEAKRMRERLDFLSRMAQFSPLKIGEIVSTVKKSESDEELPKWRDLLIGFQNMRPGTEVNIDPRYIPDIAAALDTMFQDLKMRPQFSYKVIKNNGKLVAVNVRRIKE